MKNKRKLLLIAFLAMMLVITGCMKQTDVVITPTPTSGGVNPITPSPTVIVSPTVDIHVNAEDLEGVKVRFIHPWAEDTQSEMASLVDQFNQTNEWGIHVVVEAPGSAGTAVQAVWNDLDEGNPPNIIAAPISLLLAIDEKEELVVDLEPYVVSREFGMDQDRVNDFTQVFWEEDTVDGKRYGIPAQRTATVMVYNTTWAKELGFEDAPLTVDEFEQQVCAANAIQRKDQDFSNDGMGGWIISTSYPSMLNWVDSFGAEIHNRTGFHFNDPTLQDAFEYLFNLFKSNCAWSGNAPQPYNYFANRQALVYSGQFQDILRQTSAMQLASSEDEWKVIPFPGIDGNPIVTSGFSYGVLHVESEEDLAAWLFIRWLSEPTQQARLLTTTGSYPLGKEVIGHLSNYSADYPQWQQAVDSLDNLVIQPRDADWGVISPVLEDAGWQLFNSETKTETIPSIIEQMDALAQELSERYP